MFSGFASLNDHVDQRTEDFTEQAEEIECILSRIEEEAAASLKELESHYYQGPYYCSAERTSSLPSHNQEKMAEIWLNSFSLSRWYFLSLSSPHAKYNCLP
ncbi:Mediator of RNA polymerase II transcription subunit 22a [Capsicum annuum]|nr:Mediator of RNA polymerase II transcription subunit 22a [Capsicum annuum]KAF3641309.1 Mediator of RNA polymerase II transcription subunit 22a [Capsicum annuum]